MATFLPAGPHGRFIGSLRAGAGAGPDQGMGQSVSRETPEDLESQTISCGRKYDLAVGVEGMLLYLCKECALDLARTIDELLEDPGIEGTPSGP